jgi:phenylacetate-CoA ligase
MFHSRGAVVVMPSFLNSINVMQLNLRSSRKALDHHRTVLLQRQITAAYRYVPFYRDLFDKHKVSPFDIKTIDDLNRLPIITKKDIRQNPNDIINRRYNIARCYRSHTSGSTGEPTWTYYDRPCWYRKKYFSKIRARMACGMRWGQRVVILESEATRELRLKNRKLSKLFFLLPVRFMSIFESSEHLLCKLIEFNPHNIYGPPSCLFLLAKSAMHTGAAIPALERVFTSSEYLTTAVASYIRKSLGVQIYDVYGSTETKELAWQCTEASGYHINEDEAIIEIVDDDGKVLPPENPGNIVVTDLRNRAMPLIRYRNYDKGVLLNAACRCKRGFALMQPLNGRASEYIRLPGDRYLSPFRFTTAIEKTEGLLQYQIIQERIDTIRVKTVFEKGYFDRGRTSIRSILSEVTENAMAIEIEACDKIDIEKNGKLMVVKNEIAGEPSSANTV